MRRTPAPSATRCYEAPRRDTIDYSPLSEDVRGQKSLRSVSRCVACVYPPGELGIAIRGDTGT
jgi:hypothetical protein